MRYQMELAAHAVDEDVVFGEVGCGFGVFFFPAVRPASAAALSGELAMMMRGCLGVRLVGALRVLAVAYGERIHGRVGSTYEVSLKYGGSFD